MIAMHVKRGIMETLPPSLLRDPAIRAATLSVIAIAEDHYIVPGRNGTYTIRIAGGNVHCSCLAARSGRECAHAIAVTRYYMEQHRMKVGSTVPAGSGEGMSQQPVRLQVGMYGGMLARYTQVKDYAKFNSQETEKKFFVSFVITHDAAGNQIPRFSDAFCPMRPKRFRDAKSGKCSTLFAFYAAILDGKVTPEQIAAWSDDEEPDLDDLIGYPIRLLIAPSTKPNKNGVYTNNVNTQAGGLYPADLPLKKAIGQLYKTAEFQYDDKGLRYLVSPKPEYDEIGAPVATNGSTSGLLGNPDDDEIPF